jgi:hypothetical protein
MVFNDKVIDFCQLFTLVPYVPTVCFFWHFGIRYVEGFTHGLFRCGGNAALTSVVNRFPHSG